MKTVLAVAVTALVCASSSFAVGSSVGRGEFNALRSKVARIQRTVLIVDSHALDAQRSASQALGETASIRACLRSYAMVARRNLYLFGDGTNLFAAAHVFTTTGLDFAVTGTAGAIALQIVDPSCQQRMQAYRVRR
jgi:hypothetical protein